VEEVYVKVMQVDKTIKLFQTMAIVNMNMRNLILEVNNLKNRLVTWRRRRQCYKRNWINKKSSRRGISIIWKFGGRTR
jgi:hypothetical protein